MAPRCSQKDSRGRKLCKNSATSYDASMERPNRSGKCGQSRPQHRMDVRPWMVEINHLSNLSAGAGFHNFIQHRMMLHGNMFTDGRNHPALLARKLTTQVLASPFVFFPVISAESDGSGIYLSANITEHRTLKSMDCFYRTSRAKSEVYTVAYNDILLCVYVCICHIHCML